MRLFRKRLKVPELTPFEQAVENVRRDYCHNENSDRGDQVANMLAEKFRGARIVNLSPTTKPYYWPGFGVLSEVEYQIAKRLQAAP